ncbi:MAG: BatD family protein [Myxococcota bacterium]|nr:BatD family protein [Myxococcota bacterium]
MKTTGSPYSHSLGLCLGLLALLAAPLQAQAATGISVAVDRNEVTIEDSIRLTVTIEGSRNATPQIPAIEGFEIYSGGGTTTQFQMGTGGSRSSISQSYILAPQKIGTFTIPPFSTQINGTPYQSQPFRVRVLPASTPPDQPRSLFIQANVSRTTAYLQEQLIYTWRFFRASSVQISGRSSRVEFPPFEGFISQQLQKQREYTTTIQGRRFSVTEFRFALFPQEEGVLTIPSSQLRVEVVQSQRRRGNDIFNSFFQGQQTTPKTLTSNTLTVEVQALPPEPENFSHLVGQFNVQSSLSNRQVAVGESTTLTTRISGSGSLKGFSAPPLSQLEGFKLYQDKATSNEVVQLDGVRSSKEFRTALVPLEAGQFRVPPLSVTYFNPLRGVYETATSPAYSLMVRPGSAEEKLNLTGASSLPASKSAVEMLGDDILPIHKDASLLGSGLLGGDSLPGRAATLFFPPLLFGLLWLLRSRHERERSDNSLRRKRLAMTRAVKKLKGVGTSATDQVTGGSTVLREYIGDKLNLEGRALTAAEAAQSLQNAGVQSPLVQTVTQFLNWAETAQYGSPGSVGGTTDSALNHVHQILTQLDKELPS